MRTRRIPNGIDRADWACAERPSRARAAGGDAGAGQPRDRALRPAEGQEGRRLPARRAAALGRRGPCAPAAGGLDGARDGGLAARARRRVSRALPFLDRFELLPWYAACDWIAIPSFYDGLPNVLAEAAALGIPLIAVARGRDGRRARGRSHRAAVRPGRRGACALGAAARRRCWTRARGADGRRLPRSWPRRELDARARDHALRRGADADRARASRSRRDPLLRARRRARPPDAGAQGDRRRWACASRRCSRPRASPTTRGSRAGCRCVQVPPPLGHDRDRVPRWLARAAARSPTS